MEIKNSNRPKFIGQFEFFCSITLEISVKV